MTRTILLLSTALLAAATTSARGQVIAQRLRDDVPAVTRVLPVGLARGTTAELDLIGERLEGIDRIVGPPGVTIERIVTTEAKQARLAVRVATDAAPGIYACYFLGKTGLSNPKLMRIDAWPQALEHEDNNHQIEATPLNLPCGVSGTLTAADHDWFRFEATAGESLVFDVLAQRLGSPLRPVLTLFDFAGRELEGQTRAPRDIAPDNRLVYSFRDSGTYYLRVRDLTYAGADFAVYQLRAGPIAFASAMFPLGGRRGTKTPVTFTGPGLAQPVTYEVDLSDSPAWQITRLQVPLDRKVGNDHLEPKVGNDHLTNSRLNDDVLCAPALFAVGDLPEVLEAEPNDAVEQAQRLDLPITANGRIDRPGDRDTFRFHAAAGSKLQLAVAAQQLGSPLDAVVTISDLSGKELLSLDDRQPTPREPPLVRVISPPAIDDPLGEFTAAVEGDYLLTIEDRFGNGGSEYGYRLDLSAAVGDYQLVVQPADAAAARPQPQRRNGPVQATYAGIGSGSLSLDRGGAGSLLVRVFRQGYNGPIELTVEGLPPGAHAAPATILTGQSEATISLNTDFDAPAGAGMVRVLGSTPAEGSMPAMRRLATQPVVFSSLPANGGLQQNLSDVAVGISRQGAPLAVQASLVGQLLPGGAVKAKLIAQRREGYTGKIDIKFLNLPSELVAPAAEIASDQTTAEIELRATGGLTPGIHRLAVEATLRKDGAKEPIVALFPLQFEVLPLATLELAAQQVDLALRGQATVLVKVQSNVPEPATIELALAGLPKGVAAAAAIIQPGIELFELTLAAGDDAKASPIRRIIQVKPRLKTTSRSADLPTLRFALRLNAN